MLDLGLEETFPASDPVAITQPPHSARDKRDGKAEPVAFPIRCRHRAIAPLIHLPILPGYAAIEGSATGRLLVRLLNIF